MAAGILLTQEKIREHLRSKGYEPTDVVYRGHTQRYLYWRTPWGHVFVAPDEDFKCPTWTLEEIVQNVEKTRPPSGDAPPA